MLSLDSLALPAAAAATNVDRGPPASPPAPRRTHRHDPQHPAPHSRRAHLRASIHQVLTLPPASDRILARANLIPSESVLPHVSPRRRSSGSPGSPAKQPNKQAQSDTRDGAIPYAGARKRHKDVAATNAMVQVMASPAFEALTVSVARARVAHQGTGAAAAAGGRQIGCEGEWVLMPKMKIPMEYVRRLRDVDELEKRLERDERVAKARGKSRIGARTGVPVDGGGQQGKQIELMFAADIRRGSRPSTAALANEHRRDGRVRRAELKLGSRRGKAQTQSAGLSGKELPRTKAGSGSNLLNVESQTQQMPQHHVQESVARIPMHISDFSSDFDPPIPSSHARIAHFQEPPLVVDENMDQGLNGHETPMSAFSSASPSRIPSSDSLPAHAHFVHRHTAPQVPPPLPVHECLSAATRKVLRRITAVSATGPPQRFGTTRQSQGAMSPTFMLDDSLALTRSSTPAPPSKATNEREDGEFCPSSIGNAANNGGNPVDFEIVRVLCGTTTDELDKLLDSTAHHRPIRKLSASSVPTSRTASATTSFDLNVLLDGRESQGLVRILTGSRTPGPDGDGGNLYNLFEDASSRAAMVATPLADAHRRMNTNRIIRAPVKITEKWHASKVMLDSLVGGGSAADASASMSSSTMMLAPGQVGRVSAGTVKKSIVNLAGPEESEEEGEIGETTTGTRTPTAVNSASTVILPSSHWAPASSMVTIGDVSTSQLTSRDDIFTPNRPPPPTTLETLATHKQPLNRPLRSRLTIVPPPAVVVDKSAVPMARSRAESILTAPEAVNRPLRNHTPGSVYVIDRPTRLIHTSPSTAAGGLRAVAMASKQQQQQQPSADGEPWSAASSTVASIADLAQASNAARRRSVVHEFGAGAAVVAAVKAAAKAAEAVDRLGSIEGDEDEDRGEGGVTSRRSSDATTSFKRLQLKNAMVVADNEFPAKYCIEASAFMATVKSMGAKYRTGHLPNFPTMLTLDEIANTIHRLELTAIPATLPPNPRGESSHPHLPRSLTDPLEWALTLNYQPLAQNAARLAWIASKGHIPSQLVPHCRVVFFDMLCNNPVTDQRLAAAALAQLGHRTDPRMVAFLARQLGEVDGRARQVAIEALSSAEPERMCDVLQVVHPLLAHSNPAVRSDAVTVVEQVAATWREKYPKEYRENVVGEPKLVAADGGDKYDAVVAVGQQQQQQQQHQPGSLSSLSASQAGDAGESGSALGRHDSDEKLAPVSLADDEALLRDCLIRIVVMMIGDWDLSLRDQCSQVVAEFDLVPLLLNHASGLLRDTGLGGRQAALKIMSIIKLVTVDMWEPFLEVFSDDYASVRAQACLTAHSIGMSHSKLVKELLNKLTDSEPNVRACSVKALSTVATGPKIAFEIFNLLLNFLDHELTPQVKESGCDSIVVFVNACDEHVRTFAATGMGGSTGTGGGSSTTGNGDGNASVPAQASSHLSPSASTPVAPGSPRSQRSRPGSTNIAPGGTLVGQASFGAAVITASNPRSATSAEHLAVKTASPRESTVNVASDLHSNPNDPNASGNDTASEPKSAVQRAAWLGERARALLVKWYTRGHRDELRLRDCAESALVALGVHVASLAVSDSGLSGDSEVCEVVAAETREELKRVREKYAKGQVTECALGNVETALALATMQPSLASSSSASSADGDTPASVVSRRIKQLGTRANVLRQLSLMDKLESNRFPSQSEHGSANPHKRSNASSADASNSGLDQQRSSTTAHDEDTVWKMMTEGPNGADLRAGKNTSFVMEEDEIDPDGLPDTVDVTLGGVIDGLPLSGPRQTMGTALNSRRQSLLAMAPITAALTSSRPSTSGSDSLAGSSHSLTSRRGSTVGRVHSRSGGSVRGGKLVTRRDSVVMRRMFSR